MFVPNWVKVFGSKYIKTSLTDSNKNFKLYSQHLSMERSHFKALDRPSEPCASNEKNFQVSSCIAKLIEKQTGCNIRIYGNRGSVKQPPCNSLAQLRNLTSITRKLHEADATTIYNLTGCLASCDRYEYHRIDSQMTSASAGMFLPSHLTMTFSMVDKSIEDRHQYVIYDFNSFIADVGGLMGLLLGFSILSIYDEVEKTLRKIKYKSILGLR